MTSLIGAARCARRWAARATLPLLFVVAYAALDVLCLLPRRTAIDWGLRLARGGVVTWVDPNGLAGDVGVRLGDLVRGLRWDASAHTYAVDVVGHGWLSRYPLGPTASGQLMVVVGLLVGLMGCLAWAFGRRGRPARLLAALSLSVAVTLLAYVWEDSGYIWAERGAFLAGAVLTPVLWATFFLSFPRDRLRQRPWRLAWAALVAPAALVALGYLASLLSLAPYDAARLGAGLVVGVGALLGLAALLAGWRAEMGRVRQQRRILALAAAGAALPVLLLSVLPAALTGVPLVDAATTAFAFVLLPGGCAYAIARYDLLGLDRAVRRFIAVGLGAGVLVPLAVAASALLSRLWPLSPTESGTLMAVAGALLAPVAARRMGAVAERLLAPELVRSRDVLREHPAALLRDATDLALVARRCEDAARRATGAAWTRLIIRRADADAVFTPGVEASRPLHLPRLAALVGARPWGVEPPASLGPLGPLDSPGGRRHQRGMAGGEGVDAGAHGADGDVDAEWRSLVDALPAAPALLAPLRLHEHLIGIMAVGAEAEAPLDLTDANREGLALILDHFVLAVDHARVTAALAIEAADSSVMSTLVSRLHAADADALTRHVVEDALSLRGVVGSALYLWEPGDAAPVAAAGRPGRGRPPREVDDLVVADGPAPRAWLPLHAGGRRLGALGLWWRSGALLGAHVERQLAVYAHGIAMALEQAQLLELVRVQAERDSVTDLYNHRTFNARLDAALSASSRGVGVVLVDVCDFKLFNDTHGHVAGDQALRKVADLLRACCGPGDVAARLGGDEFALLLPDAPEERVAQVAEALRVLAESAALAAPGGRVLPIRLSLGFAASPDDGTTGTALLTRADERLYAAKRAGLSIVSVGARGTRAESPEVMRGFDLLDALVAAVDNRDRYTAEHSEQVAAYACAIAMEIGLSLDTIRLLRQAGRLHDVGKIGIPDRILRKPAALTEDEVAVMRRHVELSEVLVGVVAGHNLDLLDAIRHHHERWDGGGYPRGVSGTDVPMIGRIMIVADAVSAMGMDRPYRKGLPWPVIARELTRNAGTQFDPALAAVAARVLTPHFAISAAG